MHRIVAASILFVLASTAVAVAASDRIMVRATSVLPDSVGAVLLDVGQALPRLLEPRVSVEAEIQAYCGGSVSNHYRDAFVALNKDPPRQYREMSPVLKKEPSPLVASTNRRTMLFPPCPQIRRNVTVVVQPGDSLNSLLERELGAKPDTRLLVCKPDAPDGRPGACDAVKARDIIAKQIDRDDAKFNEMASPPRTLSLPFTSRWATIFLAPEVTPDEATHRLQVAAAASEVGDGLLAVVQAPELNLVTPLAEDDSRLTGICAPGSPTPPTWPFDIKATQEAIAAALAFVRANEWKTTRSVIRVADTGVTGLGKATGFPANFLAVNPAARPGDLVPDRNGFAGAYYGIDAEYGGHVEPLLKDPNGGHGTQVSNLALGSASFRAEYGKTADLLGLNVARLFTDHGYGAGVWANAAILGSVLTYEPPSANVVNLSLGGPDPIPSLRGELIRLSERRQLVVIAAGNEGGQLGTEVQSFPAVYVSVPQIMSSSLVVGAHGPVGDIGQPVRARFSNYGRDYVDLFAPGCRLPAVFGQSGSLAGTSFAAPLVAFTAALIRDFLSDPESPKVRNRLWATTRWVSDEDAESTRFGGILDVPAALRIFDDLVRLRGGELVPGRWVQPNSFEPCTNAAAVPPRWVLRVRVETPGADLPKLHLLKRDNNEVITEAPSCVAAGEDGPRLLLDSGEERTFRWRDIEALIPAVELDRRRVPAKGPQVASGVASPATTDVQAALTARGASLAVDGKFGPETRAAIQEFQRIIFNAPTGSLTPSQIKTLFR
jgi:hypothetical protein